MYFHFFSFFPFTLLSFDQTLNIFYKMYNWTPDSISSLANFRVPAIMPLNLSLFNAFLTPSGNTELSPVACYCCYKMTILFSVQAE